MASRYSRRLVAVHAVNALCLVAIMAAAIGGIAVVDILRAFVNGEAMYSKAQKGAVIALHHYARSGDPADFADYQSLIALPVNDRHAREIIEDESRPLAESHAFLKGGGNHPDDVAGLVWLFRNFGDTSLFVEPAEAWREADRKIAELQESARALREAIRGGAGQRAVGSHLAHIDALDADLTRLEATFSDSMGKAARKISQALFYGIGGLGLALGLLGGGFAVSSGRRVQAAAREAERERELLGTTLENLGQGVSVVDADLNALKFNRRFLELLDFPADCFAPGDPFEKFIRYNCERGEYGPGDIEEIVGERVAAAQRFEPHHIERTRPDGTVLEIRGQPLPSGGFVTTYRDVTAERRVQAALEASEKRIRAVLDQALDAIVTVDAEDWIIAFNPAAERIFGRPCEEALGQRMADLLVPERLRAQHRAGMDRYLRSGETRMLGRRREMTALRASGEEFPIEIALTVNRAGDAPIFTAFIHDITRRKESEAARRAAEERLWAFIDGSPEPVSMKDKEGRYVLCNSAFAAMTGVSRDSLPGMVDDEVFPAQPELHETIRRHEAEVVRSCRPVAQLREWSGGGRPRSFVVVKFPVFGAESELAGIGTINQEVTELRNAEAQLRQAHKIQALGLLTGGRGARLQQPPGGGAGQSRAARRASRGRAGKAGARRRRDRGGPTRRGADAAAAGLRAAAAAGAAAGGRAGAARRHVGSSPPEPRRGGSPRGALRGRAQPLLRRPGAAGDGAPQSRGQRATPCPWAAQSRSRRRRPRPSRQRRIGAGTTARRRPRRLATGGGSPSR